MSSTVTASARQYTRANSEYHSIADNALFNLGSGDFAIACFFRIDGNAGTFRHIAGQNDSSFTTTSVSFNLYVTTGNVLSGRVYSGSTAYAITGGTALSLNTWCHAILQRDGNNLQLYLNGSSDASATDVTGITVNNSTNQLAVGRTGELASNYFDGKICTYAMWSRKLTAGEIASISAGKLYKDLTTDEKVSLINWYDGAETSGVLIDAHTNALNMTDNNTVTSAAGKVTYTAEDASQFTAANSEYLSVATSGNLAPGDNDFTITGWFYLDSSASDMGIASVLNYGGAFGNNYSWVVFYKTSTNVINFDVDSLGTVAAGYHRVSSTVALSTSKWFFFAARHDATANTIEIRTNLETWQSAAHSGGAYAGNAPFRVGAYGITSVTAFFNGRIADVNYWNSKLSDANVEAIYQRGFGRDYSEAPTTTGLVGWWEMTESSGNRADSHGSFTLTDNNTVTGNPGVVYDVPAVSTTKALMLLGVG